VQELVLKRTDQVLPHYVVHLKPRPSECLQFSLAFTQAPFFPATLATGLLKPPVTAAALQQAQVQPQSAHSKSKGGASAMASKRGRR
jgi:hypothetical protein